MTDIIVRQLTTSVTGVNNLSEEERLFVFSTVW